jgi:hypothetical protein
VESESGFGPHPSWDGLEEYLFKRLSAEETEALEEHLLVCVPCQDKLHEVDEYILLMKQAAMLQRANPRVWGMRRSAWAGAAAAVAAMVVGAVLMVERMQPVAAPERIELQALRGADDMAHASAGRPIQLMIDASDLPGSTDYKIVVVNTLGEPVWEGPAVAAQNRLSALVKSLKHGVYWVRLSIATGQLLREFGLRVE